MIEVRGFAAKSATTPLVPFTFQRRDPGAHDVRIEILYSGVCHSDLHQAKGDWGNSVFPMVPGHEIVGRVVAVGSAVSKFKVGDFAGVGCMVDSCRECDSCKQNLEQYCTTHTSFTYNGTEQDKTTPTQGGYSTEIVVEERFVVKISEKLDLKATAPLLCAGITTYSPLRHWKVGPGQKVGVIGLGGLGHMGVKFAKAMGAHVTMITTSASKGEDAKRLGADAVLLSTDAEAMKAQASSFDFLLNTVPVSHDINPYTSLLKLDGTMVLVGALTPLDGVIGGSLMLPRRTIAGSAIGGMAETQEMMDFCAEHNIVSDIEVVDMSSINETYVRLAKNDVRYRFVIDMATMPA
ncbi:MAG: NAD(P)-dependent alcohol dehydrogenase [Luteibacter sp.]|uniref:NAD(P)-dependent alcohol dehydrogenase n=1 Tax=unclassified Luteibacter TaxID=2620188 RepID=UPI0005B8E8AA|nr:MULTISPECIES: NAD(P)-dependent alcohol dehydrogenase [unclassified Luteibacter]MDQ7995750.1 NAD(P)-dependent alcohol dehydrogenase [Luteibacter sp.]MDQ8051252.1 NAD(P)-dependent alcohol dehydrogenase [Luteibacter sp.]